MYDINDFSYLSNYLDSEFSCIVCNSNSFEEYAKKSFLSAKKCSICGMISVNPYLTDEGVSLFYDDYFKMRTSSSLMNELRKDQYKIDYEFLSRTISEGSVLDIGCSGGYFLSNFPSSWEKFGIDLTLDAALEAKSKFGIEVYTGKVNEFTFTRKFDVVSMRGVIEHFKNPSDIFNLLPQILNPDGYFYISATPTGNNMAFELFRENWGLFTPLEHVHFFSPGHITKMLGEKFELVDIYFPYNSTPYANPNKDSIEIENALRNKYLGLSQINKSPAFPGSMMNALWRYTP